MNTNSNLKKFRRFKQLHHLSQPFLLSNVWDACSARIAEQQGAKAIATSSAAIAWSCGYRDGVQLPKETHLQVINNILRATHLPVSIDIENGYSDDPSEVACWVLQLINLGVAGINIEDGDQAPRLLCEKISRIRQQCGEHIVINARTDVFLQGAALSPEAIEEVYQRLEAYFKAGADCGFVPGLTDHSALTRLTKLNRPLNVMLSSAAQMEHFTPQAIPRFSLGPARFIQCYAQLLDNQGDNADFAYFNQLME